MDFPSGPGVNNLPANEGDEFKPWSRKTPRAWGNWGCVPALLRLGPRVQEPRTLEPMLRNKKPPQREDCTQTKTNK